MSNHHRQWERLESAEETSPQSIFQVHLHCGPPGLGKRNPRSEL